MTFNWLIRRFVYGAWESTFSITTFDVDLVFNLQLGVELDGPYFEFTPGDKKRVVHERSTLINKPVTAVYLVCGVSEERSYNILNFEINTMIVNIGTYTVDQNVSIICSIGLINFFLEPQEVTDGHILVGTEFERLRCLFDKKYLAKELLIR